MSEEHYVKVANAKDIQPSQMKEVEVNGENICVVNVEGKYYAIGSICTHEGGPLADGTLEGYEVECPWHNSKFDVRTGLKKFVLGSVTSGVVSHAKCPVLVVR